MLSTSMSTLILFLYLLAHQAATPPAAAPIWLDRPLANWNAAGRTLPAPPPRQEPAAALERRCPSMAAASSTGEQALASAGWTPYRYFGRAIVQDDVEIVGGLAGADGMCRPAPYNVFVFVGGRFAGTLAPTVMTSRLDGASGAVQLNGAEIRVDFARYTATDPLCCPSSHVEVRYRIDRTTQGPVVVPVSAAPVR